MEAPVSADDENWGDIYQNAVLELGHAKMRGRIGDARVEPDRNNSITPARVS